MIRNLLGLALAAILFLTVSCSDKVTVVGASPKQVPNIKAQDEFLACRMAYVDEGGDTIAGEQEQVLQTIDYSALKEQKEIMQFDDSVSHISVNIQSFQISGTEKQALRFTIRHHNKISGPTPWPESYFYATTSQGEISTVMFLGGDYDLEGVLVNRLAFRCFYSGKPQ